MNKERFPGYLFATGMIIIRVDRLGKRIGNPFKVLSATYNPNSPGFVASFSATEMVPNGSPRSNGVPIQEIANNERIQILSFPPV
jgi:hypothetical protein